MTSSEWLDWYVKHGGNYDLQLDDRERVLFHPDHGFISCLIHDDVLELHHMAGNGKFWLAGLKNFMKEAGLTKLRAFTKRNPKAWMRKYGGHIRGYYMEADLNEFKV